MSEKKMPVWKFRKVLRQFERIIGDHSKRCCSQVSNAQCHVLLEIDVAETTTGALALALNLDTSTISRTVDGLVKAGLVERSENPEDRRSIMLRTTQAGAELAEHINRDADMYFAQVLGSIPEQSRAEVLTQFNILVSAFVANEQLKMQSFPLCECNDE